MDRSSVASPLPASLPLWAALVLLRTQADIVSVDRTHKGNRLPLAPKHTSTSTGSPSVVTTLSRPNWV